MDYDILVDDKEQLEAYKIYFKKMFNVDIQDEDNKYKSLYQTFEDANKNIHTKH